MSGSAMRLIPAAVLLAATLLTGARARAEQAAQPAASCLPAVTHSSVSFTPLVSAENSFGFRLFDGLLGSNNVFISPTSIATALGMAYDGARGGTAAAMAQTLSLRGIFQTSVRGQASSLLHALQVSGSDTGLAIANSLWARQNVRFQAAFMQNARRDYGATVRSLDFSSPQAPATINRWVSCATQGKIPSIVDRIPAQAVLYLINAEYFHGDWAQPFPAAGTRTRTFTTAAGATAQVPMMSQIAAFPYYQGPDFQAIALPYKTARFQMMVLLPKQGTSLQSFGRQVTAANWRRWSSRLQTAMGTVVLPKFTITDDLLLNHSLAVLGMGPAFSTHADFSGMCVQRCRLSDVRHKTYLAINEKGTVAAAVTSVGVVGTGIPASQFQMVVDHPFFLGIQDRTTGAVLFLGAIANPVA